MDEAQAMFRAILERIDEHSAKIERLAEDMNILMGEMKNLHEKVDRIEEKLDKHEKLLETLAFRYLEVDSEVRRLKAR